MDKAVAAAHTFFQANPNHMEMKQNLDYYRMMAGVKEEDFKDLEIMPHMVRVSLLGYELFGYVLSTCRVKSAVPPDR